MISKYGFTGFSGAPEAMDTLYEICDAEFNSFNHVHVMFDMLESKHQTFKGKFAIYLKPLVKSIAIRDNLYHQLSYANGPIEAVADKIAQDWINERTTERLIERASAD